MRLAARALVVAAALGAAATATAAAGCGGAGGDDASTTATTRNVYAHDPAEVLACRTLTPDDVRALLVKVGYDAPQNFEVEFKTDTKELSDCRYFAGDEVGIWLTIDRAHLAVKRYWYRLEEQQQRHAPDPQRRPKLVFGVGQDKTYGGAGAYWTPSLDRLMAFRDKTMLVIGFRVHGIEDAKLRAASADLARLAYDRLFHGRPPGPVESLEERAPHP